MRQGRCPNGRHKPWDLSLRLKIRRSVSSKKSSTNRIPQSSLRAWLLYSNSNLLWTWLTAISRRDSPISPKKWRLNCPKIISSLRTLVYKTLRPSDWRTENILKANIRKGTVQVSNFPCWRWGKKIIKGCLRLTGHDCNNSISKQKISAHNTNSICV